MRTELFNALRLGQLLVAEVPAGDPGRRAFVAIYPLRTAGDVDAERGGWKKPVSDRGFNVYHREFAREHMEAGRCIGPGDGMWDLGEESVATESELEELLRRWAVPADELQYSWSTDYPV
jgi:hypothetical protein